MWCNLVSKVNIKTSIESKSEKVSYSCVGILNNNKLVYKDKNDILVTLYMNDNKILLTRESNDYILKLDFFNNMCDYYLKDVDNMLYLKLDTTSIQVTNNGVCIDYNLEDDKFSFKIKYEVIK